jgi:uncharacterized protein
MRGQLPKARVPFDLESHTILLTISGSRAYGTATEDSDWDFKGCFCAPKRYYLSPFRNVEEVAWKNEALKNCDKEEGTVYELTKFIKLACNANPNILEILFCRDSEVLKCSPEGELLRKNRDLFLSRRAAKAFTGYAFSQLSRIRRHKSWLDKPILERPTREEFGLLPAPRFTNSEWGALRLWIQRNIDQTAPFLIDSNNTDKELFYGSLANLLGLAAQEEGLRYDPDLHNWHRLADKVNWTTAEKLGLDTNFVQEIQKEKAYRRAVKDYKSYQDWLKNRNPERAALEAKYGFDCKHGSHLIRLLRMGYDLFMTGKLDIWRDDADELLAIRNGSKTYEEIVEWAEKRTDEIYVLLRSGDTALPKNPAQNKIEELNKQILESLWSRT